MNETPADNGPSAAGDSAATTEVKRRGALPWWLWVLIVALVLGMLALVAIPILTANKPEASPSTSPTPAVNEMTTPTETQSPTPTPTASDVGQGTFDSDMFNYVSDVLNSQNTAVLDQGGTFSNPVHVVTANSGQDSNLTPRDAVEAMGFMFTPMDLNPWDLASSDSVLTTYRSGPFGQYFPEGAIVARSSDGHVFSFIGHDKIITTMFMSVSDDYLK
ncbi:MAG: hypothetical protein ABIW32_09265 [Terrimesophilobacter sp.]